MDGFIDFLKPPGMTSSDAVLFVRKLLPRKTPVGHGGTLDPDAAGVLPICVGKATRLFDYIVDKRKVYIGELLLGIGTDTADTTGKVLERSSGTLPGEEEIRGVLSEFTGEILQVPPIYSALKRGGTPLYLLARRGECPELEPRSVCIDSIEYLERTAPDRHLLRITCRKGVYIRSLMRDLGEKLGCPGCMSFLLREESGAFTAQNGFTPDELREAGPEKALKPMDTLLGAYPFVRTEKERRKAIINGMPVKKVWLTQGNAAPGEIVRLYCGEEFAGMAEGCEDGSVKLRAMLLYPEN